MESATVRRALQLTRRGLFGIERGVSGVPRGARAESLRLYGLVAPVVCASMLVHVLGGCGTADSDFVFDGSGMADAGSGSDGSGSTDPDVPLRPCEAELDCRGGETCLAGVCRESCRAGEPCDGPFFACDASSGFCVECLDDADCAGQAFLCDPDLQTCSVETCAATSDCPGGTLCADSRCVSLDDVICEPGIETCVDNTVEACSADGTELTRARCADRTSCVVDDNGIASCVDWVCDPLDTRCSRLTSVERCADDGTAWIETECAEDEVCDAGSCLPTICEAAARECDGLVALECNAIGTAGLASNCADPAVCGAEENGCSCVNGECVARVCIPGASECAASGVRVCNATGDGWSDVVACDADQACQGGECISRTCTPGALECAGNLLLTCQADGRSRTTSDCGAAGRACFEDFSATGCSPRVCVPGERLCLGDSSTAVVCDALGASYEEDPCAETEVCRFGACAPRACDPTAPARCQNGSVVLCDAELDQEVIVENCPARGLICVDGACQ